MLTMVPSKYLDYGYYISLFLFFCLFVSEFVNVVVKAGMCCFLVNRGKKSHGHLSRAALRLGGF